MTQLSCFSIPHLSLRCHCHRCNFRWRNCRLCPHDGVREWETLGVLQNPPIRYVHCTTWSQQTWLIILVFRPSQSFSVDTPNDETDANVVVFDTYDGYRDSVCRSMHSMVIWRRILIRWPIAVVYLLSPKGSFNAPEMKYIYIDLTYNTRYLWVPQSRLVELICHLEVEILAFRLKTRIR